MGRYPAQSDGSETMTYQPGKRPFNPLLVGAIAVIAALAAFLIFRDGVDTTQQAGIESPTVAPATPTPASPAPKGSGNL
jgi:hypothetical protein